MTNYETVDLDLVDKHQALRIAEKIALTCKARVWIKPSNYKGWHLKILCNRSLIKGGCPFCIARWLFDDHRRFHYDETLRDHPAKRNVLWSDKRPLPKRPSDLLSVMSYNHPRKPLDIPQKR